MREKTCFIKRKKNYRSNEPSPSLGVFVVRCGAVLDHY